MATQAISEFPALPAGQVASDDLLPIVDVSDLASPTGTTKKMLVASLGEQLNARNTVFNVQDPTYGATGNGSTEDAPAIQAAIDAAAPSGGIVYMPYGTYKVSTQLVLPPGVAFVGVGQSYGSVDRSAALDWRGTGFCLKVGNSASSLSRGNRLADFQILTQTGNSGIWLYGVSRCSLTNISIEGVVGTTTTIGVQFDGADISLFFVTLDNVNCNHVFKGFVHTTTGSIKPTQVLGQNCTAFCDHTAGSIGIDVQNVGGAGCGDGVTYVGGNMEACATGVHLNAGGTAILGMRFENTQTVASDITFDTLALDNQVIGCCGVYTITDLANRYSNQVIATSLDTSSNLAQQNKMAPVTIGGATPLAYVTQGTNTIYGPYIPTGGSGYAGHIVMQAGLGSAGTGGAINLYGHAHATHPGDVVAGLSSGSGGKFRVNTQALDAGTDRFIVDSSGNCTVGAGFGCNGTTPQTAVASGGAAPAGGTGATAGAYDTAAHRDALITLVNTMRTALVACGILT